MRLSLTKLFGACIALWSLFLSLSAGAAAPADLVPPATAAVAPLSLTTDCVNNPTPAPGISPAATTVAQGGSSVSLTVSGCTGGYVSYFGTDGVSRSVVGGIISVPTTATGVYTISAICTNNNCRSQAATSTVTIRPSSVVTAPAPTVANPVPDQGGVAGTGFTFLIPTNTFQDINNNPLTLTVSGLPAGLFFNGLIITGPLTTAGTFPITVSATNIGGASVAASFFLVVSPGTGGLLQLTTPTYNPCTRAITFNTSGGDGTPITFSAVGVQRSSPQSTTGIVEAPVVADNKTLSIFATQSGRTVSIGFTPTPCVTPPPSGTALQLTTPTYNPCTRAIVFNTTGGDGTPVSFTAVGVQRSSPQSTTGIVDAAIAVNGSSVIIIASQSGQTVSISFALAPCTTPPTPTSALQLTTPTYDPCSRAIVFNTTGGDGTAITFTAVGVQRSSPQSTTGIVEASVVADNKTLTILASQSGQTTSTVFTPVACATVTPPPSGTALQLTTPTYNPCSRAIVFNTTGGDGTPISFTAVGVQRSSPQSTTGIVEPEVVLDNKTLTIFAGQSGRIVSVTFTPTSCSTTPPATTTALQLTTPTYNPCSRAIVFNTTGGNGSPVTFVVPGVQRSSPQSASGIVEVGVVADNKTLNIQAIQNGVSVSITFTPTQCGTRIGTDSDALTIRVLGNPVQGETVAVEIAGAEGQPLEVRLLDAQGRLQFSHEVGSAGTIESVRVPVGSLKAGMLLFQAITPGRVSVVKLLKAW